MLQPSTQARWIRLAAIAFVCLGILVLVQRVQAVDPQSAAPLAPAQAGSEQALAAALAAKDYAALARAAAPEINVVRWLGDRRMLAAADALAELQADYLDPAADPYIDSTSNLAAWFGVPPADLWQDAIAVDRTIYLRGLGADGAGDALVAVSEAKPGSVQWTGLLLAESGFGLPDARDENPQAAETGAATSASAEVVNVAPPAAADATQIEILRSVNVYSAPDASSPSVGLMRRNQTLPVLGVTDDGAYFQIACPRRVEGECWVANEAGFVTTPGSQSVVAAEAPSTPEPEVLIDTSIDESTAPADSTADLQATAEPVVMLDTSVDESTSPADAAADQEAAPEAVAATAASAVASAPERISFLTGEVSANRTGVVEPAAPVSYILRVLAGQSLTVDLVSGGDVANFSVTGAANGQPYKAMSNPARNWTFTVPVTQDYVIRLEAPVPTQYSLTVVAPPLAARPPVTPTTVAVERISFGSGETAAMRSGSLGAGQSKEYLIRVLKGQQVTTEFYATGSAGYSIVGADGTELKPSASEINPFTFIAPATQDYRVRIMATTATEYDFIVTIPPLNASPTATPSAPVRLSVEPGGTSVSATDIVAAYGRDQYLVAASAGQTMYVSLQSPNDVVNFSIVGVLDGQPLKRVENEDRSWSGTLPTTQDYLITVVNPTGVRVEYTLYVQFSPLGGTAPTPTAATFGTAATYCFPGRCNDGNSRRQRTARLCLRARWPGRPCLFSCIRRAIRPSPCPGPMGLCSSQRAQAG